MLRALLVLLLAANALWWAASQGWLPRAWLPLPDDEVQREPQRLAAQLHPGSITVLADAGTPAARPAPAAVAGADCVVSPPLEGEALRAAEAALQAAGIDAGRWQRMPMGSGTALRVDDASPAERDALGAGTAAGAGAPGFSRCP